MEGWGRALTAWVLIILWAWALYLYTTMWMKPERLRRKLRRQGLRGPHPSFLRGNLAEIEAAAIESAVDRAGDPLSADRVLKLFPHLERWKKQYGPNFVYTRGNAVVLCVGQPSLVRLISLQSTLDLGKPTYLQKEDEPLLGQSIVRSNGLKWLHQRKIVGGELYASKIKGMVSLMADSALPFLQAWERRIDAQQGVAEIDAYEDLKTISADIISRACFGSSYAEGEQIFLKLRSLALALSRTSLRHLPLVKYLPTKTNKEIERLSQETRTMILDVVKQRMADPTSGNDLLQSIIDAATHSQPNDNVSALDNFIVDNCRTIYLAGQETTAASIAWCLQLLALHPIWQESARLEVVKLCGTQVPSAEVVSKMKVLTMVIQETMRLYPPTGDLPREVLDDIQIGDLQLPKGINITFPILTLHYDVEIWGQDAHEFNPERFAHGVSAACKSTNSYLPFGYGPRTCPGMNFAMTEAKIILALILSRFSFTLSSNYFHTPTHQLTIVPKNGVKLLVKKI